MTTNTHNEKGIADLSLYNEQMAAVMPDKLWFINHTDVQMIVDYGCADGTLLEIIHNLYPEAILIGVDISIDMLRLAREKVPTAILMTVDEFFACGLDFSNAILVLNSVIHEIYSYDMRADFIIQSLLQMGFGTIAIRDMFVSQASSETSISDEDFSLFLEYSDPQQVADFAECWGAPKSMKSLVHFLLKYRYTENWTREVAENYLPISLEAFIDIADDYYEIAHVDHHIPAFIHSVIFDDFGIDLSCGTHCKMLLILK